VPRYASPINFFKRKKRKKESQSSKWKVSKKQVFLKKILPDALIGIASIIFKHSAILELKGWRFF
jgi:hypothetical protein